MATTLRAVGLRRPTLYPLSYGRAVREWYRRACTFDFVEWIETGVASD